MCRSLGMFMLSQRPLIALDIGSSSVKILELTGGHRRKLAAIGLDLLPPGTIVEGEIRDESVVLEVCQGLMEKLRIMPKSKRAAIALGGSAVTVKKIAVHLDPRGNVEEQIYYEAEQYLGRDISDLYFRFKLLSERPDEQGAVPVVLAGARRDLVEQHMSVVRRVGLRIGVVDCQPLCLTNMFEANYPPIEPAIAILNIGASVSQLVLMKNGQILFSRDIYIAGDEYTRQIAESLGVSYENAEGLKVAISVGEQSAPNEVKSVVDHLNQLMANEIRSAFEFYEHQGDAQRQGPITHLLLSGGGARVFGLDAALTAMLQLPVQMARPFQSIEVPMGKFDTDYILSQGHLYGVAMGLGLRLCGDHED